jgi:hypothetical protein
MSATKNILSFAAQDLDFWIDAVAYLLIPKIMRCVSADLGD